MQVANPAAPAATGATMTLEQGVAKHLAVLKATGAKANDVLVADATEPEPTPEAQEPEGETAAHEEENTEAVSEENQEPDAEIPLNGKISMPDGSTITAEEARKGYLRQADFTRKTQDLAVQRDAFTAERNTAMNQVGGLYQQLASLQEAEPNWLQLSQDPNVDAKQLRAYELQWQHKKTVMGQAQQALEHNRQLGLQAERAKAFQALNSGEFEPAWKDPAKLKTGLATVSDYLIERGLPAEVLDGITNPLVIEIAEESRRYRELQKAKPKAALAVKGKPAPFKPGAKSTATPQSEHLRSLEEAFRKNPTIDTATAFHAAKAARR